MDEENQFIELPKVETIFYLKRLFLIPVYLLGYLWDLFAGKQSYGVLEFAVHKLMKENKRLRAENIELKEKLEEMEKKDD